MKPCQFCHSTENVHNVGGIYLCQKCMLAIYEHLKDSPPQDIKKEKEIYKFVN